ncbi:MAG: cupin domain-containing protein [Pseudomonadota bacterium]
MATTWTRADLRDRLVRYSDLIPCRSAFIDTRTPGSQEKENFTIIGPGVAENPEQHVHIALPHGFNIGGARQPPGCVNSQHSHETAEVFVVKSGTWKFTLGESGDDGHVILEPGDTISIPTQVFRGFTNVGTDEGFLFAVLGGDDPGHVTWAPYVFDMAKDYGLVLLSDGRLVDTTRGETVPPDAHVMPPTTAETVAQLQRMTSSDLESCVIRFGQSADEEQTLWPGFFEAPLIGAACPRDGQPEAHIAWPHGFQLRRQRLQYLAASQWFFRAEPEVVMVFSGQLTLETPTHEFTLKAGDVMTVPIDMPRRYRNDETEDAISYIVRGGDQPTGFQPAEPAAA